MVFWSFLRVAGPGVSLGVACGAEAFTLGLLCVFSSTGRTEYACPQFNVKSQFFQDYPGPQPTIYKVILRVPIVVLFTVTAFCQLPDPAYQPLDRAYAALARSRMTKQSLLSKGHRARSRARRHPQRPGLHLSQDRRKRAGPRPVSRGHGMDPADIQVALEYAFLCYETKQQAEARRIFDRIRRTGRSRPPSRRSRISTARWPPASSVGRSIAVRGRQFQRAFRAGHAGRTARRTGAGRGAFRKGLAYAARPAFRAGGPGPGVEGDGPHRRRRPPRCWPLPAAASRAPPRWRASCCPIATPSFPNSAAPSNSIPPTSSCAANSAICCCAWSASPRPNSEFRILTETAPDDLLSATQLGFLLYARGDSAAAMPLFDRVLAGPDEDLANRVRAVLRMPQVVEPRADTTPDSIDAKVMAERSIKAGYMKDALKYLQVAHEADPGDFESCCKLGWTYNILHQDRPGLRWFDLARRSPDPQIAAEAAPGVAQPACGRSAVAHHGLALPHVLHPLARFLLLCPGQDRVAHRARFPPYAERALRRRHARDVGAVSPQYLSESSFIVAGGVRMLPWHGIGAWFEAGTAMSYVTGHMLPDYRGGVSSRAIGPRYRRIVRLVRRHQPRRGLHQPVRQRFPGLRPVALRLRRRAGQRCVPSSTGTAISPSIASGNTGPTSSKRVRECGFARPGCRPRCTSPSTCCAAPI